MRSRHMAATAGKGLIFNQLKGLNEKCLSKHEKYLSNLNTPKCTGNSSQLAIVKEMHSNTYKLLL